MSKLLPEKLSNDPIEIKRVFLLGVCITAQHSNAASAYSCTREGHEIECHACLFKDVQNMTREEVKRVYNKMIKQECNNG